MDDKKLHDEWNELFKQAEQQYAVFDDLNDISRLWQDWYERLHRMNMSGYQTVNSNCLEIRDLPKII